MALLLPVAETGKENVPIDDVDDFAGPLKKEKFNPEDIKTMFPQSILSNCTFNVTFGSKWLLQRVLFCCMHALSFFLTKVHYLFVTHLSVH